VVDRPDNLPGFVTNRGSAPYQISGGNPGGCITFTDIDDQYYFRAPAKFLGDKSLAYNGVLSFDIISNLKATPDQTPTEGVILSNGSLTISYDFAGPPPASTWTPFTVSLNHSGWFNLSTHLPITSTQMRSVLANLTFLDIRGEFGDRADTGGLDNVMLTTGPGDFNRDNAIDAADYPLWRRLIGELVPACSGPDANCNGAVDYDDYRIWRSNFGTTLGSGASNSASAAIPEPVSSVLCGLLAAVLLAKLRSRKTAPPTEIALRPHPTAKGLSHIMRIGMMVVAVGAVLFVAASPSFATIYNAVADYNYLINTNTSTWSYRYDPDPVSRLAAEPLLTVPNSEYLGGSTTTRGWTFAPGFNPGILKSTADEFRLGQIFINANKLYAAPNQSMGGSEVLSWLAPAQGTVDIAFNTRGAQDGGDYLWYVDKNGSAGNLASGRVTGVDDVESANLTAVPVGAGDRINFAFNQNGVPEYDSLEFTAEINFTPRIPGDFNRDLFVDAADYPVWRRLFAQLVPACSGPDANCNGAVDKNDYQIWRSNFGRSFDAANANFASAAVPEPATAVPCFLLAIILLTNVKRRPFCYSTGGKS
jgi:hypothetical protein